MIKNEWKALLKNKFLLVVMVALMLIPALYNLIFLPSMWDPYGKVKDLPVAVINEDQGATLNNQPLYLGKEVEKELKSSKSMSYDFVSQVKADKGLKSGKYYMAIYFPRELSKEASSFMDGNPEKVKIVYQTSKGHNFISSKMSETAMKELQQEVSGNLTEQYTKAIFAHLTDLKAGMSQATDGASQVANGNTQAAQGAVDLASHLDQLKTASLTFTDGMTDFQLGLNQYVSGLDQVSAGADQLAAASSQFSTGTQQLADGLNTLSQETSLTDQERALLDQVQGGLAQLNQAIQAGGDTSSLAPDLNSLASGIQSLVGTSQSQIAALEATPTFQTLTPAQQQELLGALQSPSAAQAVSQIQTALTDLQNQLSGLAQAQSQLQAAANQVLPGASQAMTSLSSGMDSIQSALSQQILPGANLLAQESPQLASGIASLKQGTDQLKIYGPQLRTGADQLAGGTKSFESASDQLATGGNTLGQSLQALSSGADLLASNLAKGNTDLAGTSTSNRNAVAISKPIRLEGKDKDNVKNNGVGMAPYMLSVALFVGALSTNVIFGRGISDDKRAKSGIDFMLGKLATNGFVAVMQGALVSLVALLLGVQPRHPVGLFFGAILISLMFMMIVTFLNMWLGKVGAFVSLILLLLQLATSAGTYPIQLAAPIFQAINPWLPMTYTVLYFRQVISLDGNVGAYVLLFLVLTLVFLFLLPLTTRKNYIQKVQSA